MRKILYERGKKKKEKRKKKERKNIPKEKEKNDLWNFMFKNKTKNKNPKKATAPRYTDWGSCRRAQDSTIFGGQPLAALGRRWLLLMLLWRSRFVAANLEKLRADACGF